MARVSKIRAFILSLLLIFIVQNGYSEIVVDNLYGYSLDLPEGFVLSNQIEEDLTYEFTHQNLPLTLISKIYEDQGFLETHEALDYALTKLSSQKDITSFLWNNTESAVSFFSFTLDKEYSGWAVATPIGKDTYLCLLTYGPSEYIDQLQPFMFSSLNSLCINEYFYNTPGIITSFAYPKTKEINGNVEIEGQKISYTLDESDNEASSFVIDMEFNILTHYAEHPLMYEAWSRYYRMLYRDNYGRITSFARSCYDTLYPLAEEKREDNPMIQYAQYLLSWVQDMDYVRAEKNTDSDFSSLPSILLGGGSDCDSRSMMVASILEYSGIDSLLLIYPEYHHAIVATMIEAPGQTFNNPENKEDYIMGETTAKLTWGTIAKEQADRSKCFSISLP